MEELVKALHKGELAVVPTDTIYGLIASAFDKMAVEKVYKLRKRDPRKPLIILISSLDDLKLFDIKLDHQPYNLVTKLWPGPVSIILNCPSKKFEYLHRGAKALAFRLPDKKSLIALLKQTGPIVAPSANIEGQKEAQTIKEAKGYFGEKVKVYLDEGKLSSKPSTIISLVNNEVKFLREGSFSFALLRHRLGRS